MDDIYPQLELEDLFNFFPNDTRADLLDDNSFGANILNSITIRPEFDETQDWDTIPTPVSSFQQFAEVDQSFCGFVPTFCQRSAVDTVCPAETYLFSQLPDIADQRLTTVPSLLNERTGSSKSTSMPSPDIPIMKDSIFVFHSEAGKKIKVPRRKKFDVARRKEVALNRALGACVQCKVRKEPCNLGIPCQECVRKAGNTSLGRQLCTRQKLVATRFSTVDLLGVTRFAELVQHVEDTFIPGTERKIHLTWPVCCHSLENIGTMKVVVQNFSPRKHPFGFDGHEQKLFRIGYAAECSEEWAKDAFYAMTPGSFPSLEELENFTVDTDHCCNSGPLARLHKAFAGFDEYYCKSDRPLPLKSLLQKIIRMKRLFCIYRVAIKAANTPTVINPADTEFASSWLKMQLRHYVAKSIVALEVDILNELDRLVYGYQGIGRRNPVAIWACLWTLILTYRGHLPYIYWVSFHYDTTRDSLYGLGTHIYHTLTSIYAALYKATSPMIFDWRTEEVREMLGGDEIVIKKFRNIKTEMFWLNIERHALIADDLLLKTLIVENESKLVESKLKEAKRKGLL